MACVWKENRVVVPSCAGFTGSRVVARPAAAGSETFAPRNHVVDDAADKRLYLNARPEIVIHAAAIVGANRAIPAASSSIT